MPGINQLPSGSEFAAAISLTWAFSSWACSSILLWLTWVHHEGWSYLALLAVSSLISNTFSIVQQGHDISWYAEIVSTQFERKQKLPSNDPELAIAGGSYGFDLVLYYFQYYSYNVQALLVMFWAAELCQLTYQVGERRKIRRIFRKLHAAGKFISWLLPLASILCLRIPALKLDFLAFILVADLPLMLSLAIGSALMIAVTVRYVQSRQKFTQWSPPKFNSATSDSDAGTYTSGTHTSGTRNSSAGSKGLYDRWLMVRFTIAFILLAVFEVTNTLFQVTALQNNIYDARATAPDLSAGRAIQTLFLFMPGTAPGIFLYVVFGTTRSSRQKVAQLLPSSWKISWDGSRALGFCCIRKKKAPASSQALPIYEGGITVQRSLTVTSMARTRASRLCDEEDLSETSDVWLEDIPKRAETVRSFHISSLKPLPRLPASSKSPLKTTVSSTPRRVAGVPAVPVSVFKPQSKVEDKGGWDGASAPRTSTSDSLQVLDDYYHIGAEHSDDSGPILPIQRPEVRFSRDAVDAVRRASGTEGRSRSFSRPKI